MGCVFLFNLFIILFVHKSNYSVILHKQKSDRKMASTDRLDSAKARMNVVTSKANKERLMKIASNENRSLSNLIDTILNDYLKKVKK